ncbi:hypothetical protein C1645_822806 [Glomus cerebriforme]|uniref:Arrestin C-terminal-like domain-containing protein n=1 Tax=Glomus cerebriforme TaxID=658196 RepID=A0A397SXV1_9GLOM|nr:hypothetical protein C1645_822806 [Glomus cerebriforme]
MSNNLHKGPPRSSYKEFNPSTYFSYLPGRKSFQQGYLGITGNASIVGFLHLKFPSNEPLYAKHIRISFSGTEFVQLHGTGPKFLTYGTNSICNITIDLWKSDDDDYQVIRDMDLPFEIPLPNDLPSSLSIDKDRGKIEYNLRAIILRKPNIRNFQGSTRIVQCTFILDRYILPPIPGPIKWKDDDHFKKGIGYEIILNNKVFGPHNPIILRVKLTFYDNYISLEDIILSLKEYTAIAAQSEIKKTSKYLGKKILRGGQIPILKKDSQYNECDVNIKFIIPKDCLGKLSWSNESFNIQVTHKVKIKVSFGIFSKHNINLEIPVKISNMLSEEEEICLTAEILHQQTVSRYFNSEISESLPRSNSPPPSYEQNYLNNHLSSLPPPSYSLNNETN